MDKIKTCAYARCDKPIRGRRSTKKYCCAAHRLAHFKDQHDPLRGTAAAAARKAAWLDRQQYGQIKKATVRALAKRGLGFDGADKYSADQDQDERRPYDIRWIRRYAKQPKQSGTWTGTKMSAQERLRRLKAGQKGPWEDKSLPLYVTPFGLWQQAMRVVQRMVWVDTIRALARRSRLLAGLMSEPPEEILLLSPA